MNGSVKYNVISKSCQAKVTKTLMPTTSTSVTTAETGSMTKLKNLSEDDRQQQQQQQQQKQQEQGNCIVLNKQPQQEYNNNNKSQNNEISRFTTSNASCNRNRNSNNNNGFIVNNRIRRRRRCDANPQSGGENSSSSMRFSAGGREGEAPSSSSNMIVTTVDNSNTTTTPNLPCSIHNDPTSLQQPQQQKIDNITTTTTTNLLPESASITAARTTTNHSTATTTMIRSEVSSNGDNGIISSNKKVKFSHVHIRDYERDIGDNPSCSSGPPIGIGWAHSEIVVEDVDSYERKRSDRREESAMVLSRHERELLLNTWGIEPPDIARAVRNSHKVKSQRRQTVRNLSKTTIEESMERATRTIKRLVLMRRSTDRQAKDLRKQSIRASAEINSNNFKSNMTITTAEPSEKIGM